MAETGLQGKKILLTRPAQQSAAWAQNLQAEGAISIVFPLISISKVHPDEKATKAIQALSSYDGIIFTSINGARYFLELLDFAQKELLCKMTIAVVGNATEKYVNESRLKVSFMPGQYTADELASHLPDVLGKRYLLPTTATARENLPNILRERGAEVDIIFVYTNSPRTEGKTELEEIFNNGIDLITFASPSAVEGYINLKGAGKPTCAIACIGPVTAAKAEQYGWEVNIIANTHTAEGLSDAIKTYYDYDKQTQKA